jgi:hypothetical protein
LQTIGSAYTRFQGRTSGELRRAILAHATRAEYGPRVAWGEIGVRQFARQTLRGIWATPRAMGWGPTAASFVQRVFHRR